MFKLSIIIPIYNVEEYLGDCLQSILEQDRDTIEVVMVNDASTDESSRIAQTFLTKFKNARLISHSSNQGLGPTRNTALASIHGEYVMMIDSDDWIPDNAIATVLNCIQSGEFDIAQFTCNKVYPDRSENQLYESKRSGHSISLHDAKSELLKLPCYVWLKIYRRQFLEKNRIQFQNIYYEDIPWSIYLSLCAEKIALNSETIYNYRQREGSIVNSQNNKHLDLLRAYDEMFSSLNRVDLNWRHKTILYDSFIRAAYYLFREREVRLGQANTREFSLLFVKIIARHRPYPVRLKTLAMGMILSFRLAKHALLD